MAALCRRGHIHQNLQAAKLCDVYGFEESHRWQRILLWGSVVALGLILGLLTAPYGLTR